MTRGSTLTPKADAGVLNALDAFEEASFEMPFDSEYDSRPGYQSKFLGKNHSIPLPGLGNLSQKAAPLLKPPRSGNKFELKYYNFSVVMHATRRFAIFSAANVHMGQRYRMNRPADIWRIDPRIASRFQIDNFYYQKNQFDRGHLTRREDLEFGPTPKDALRSAADTCHWSNAAPQHARFNQSKDTWQGLERHILENSIIAGQLNAQVITGPIFAEDDPTHKPFPDIQYPRRYWKIVAGLKADKTLFSVAFVLDQSDVIRKHGLREAVPIGAFKTYQTKVSEIERLTGLAFNCKSGKLTALAQCDPLRNGLPGARRARPLRRSEGESEAQGDPSEYHLLTTPASIYLG